MPVDLDDCAIYEGVFEVWLAGQGLENLFKDPFERPSAEAFPDGKPLPEVFRQITPRGTRASHPQHPFHKQTIVVSVASRITDLSWQFRCDPFPLGVAQHSANQG